MDQVEEIKQRVDIVDLISIYLELKKAGANYKALCPFHNEKTPSFMVSQDKGIFKCFGCGESGDIFTFVEKIEGVDFPEALKILAERAGIKLARIDRQFYDQKRNLYEINDIAAKVFHHLLTKDKTGAVALAYLKKRGVTEKTIKDFQLGYSPLNFEFISGFLCQKGFKESDIVASGLSLNRENRRRGSLPIFDRFRGRIMFPIFNPAGNIIAFSGRILKDTTDAPKYINSPDTPLYSKSRNLFGLDKSKTKIRKSGFVILVEGTMDVILSHQAGLENTVASLGTALTQEQVDNLARLSRRFLFAFDADEAGMIATKRGVDIALNKNVDVAVVTIPKGFKDTAEVVKSDPSLWREALLKSLPYIDYIFENAFRNKSEKLSPALKRDVASEILPEIAKISDPIVAGDYIARLALRLQTQEKYLYEAMSRYKVKQGGGQESEIQEKVRKSSKENHLLGLLLVFPQYFNTIKDFLSPIDFASPQVISIYKKMNLEYSKKRKFDFKKFISGLSADERDFVSLIVLDVENEYVEEDKDIAGEEVLSLVERIKQSKKDEASKNFEEKIKEAEKLGNKEKIKKLIREFQNLVIQGKK
ncbi:MAG: DNA primase [Candidatus Berkelbacteria bacterium]|nr:DNA primase [Candidatus Berkelbacteria bacterium]